MADFVNNLFGYLNNYCTFTSSNKRTMTQIIKIKIIETKKGTNQKNGKYQGKVLEISNPYTIVGDNSNNNPIRKIDTEWESMEWAIATDGKNQFTIWDVTGQFKTVMFTKGIHEVAIGIRKEGSWRENYTMSIEVL